MKYGMNLLLWTGHVTETHFPLFGKLRKVGYDGVEIPVFEGDEKHYAAIKKELDKQGLKSTTVTVMNEQANPISPDAKIRAAAVEHLKGAIRDCKAFGGTSVLLVPAVVNKQVGYDDAWKRSQDGLMKAAEDAQGLGVPFKAFFAEVD